MSSLSIRWIAVPVLVAVVAVLTADPRAESGPDEPTVTVPPTDPFGTELDRRLEAVRQRVAHKNELIDRLADGRLTLDEVTAEFLAINRANPPSHELVCLQYPGATEEEKTAYNVLGYLRALPMPPDRKAAVTARLGREFERRFGHPPQPTR